MTLSDVNESMIAYESAFEKFRERYPLPDIWFERPDHFAVKCADLDDYKHTVNAFRGVVDNFHEEPINGRILASAQLLAALPLSGFTFDWVEIMQPRLGRETSTGFVEHTEFVVPDLPTILEAQSIRRISDVELQDNPNHAWVNVPIDQFGREIKFTSKPLESIIVDQNHSKKTGGL